MPFTATCFFSISIHGPRASLSVTDYGGKNVFRNSQYKVFEIRYLCHLPKIFCFNNNSELYLPDYNNTALQKRGKHDNYSNLVIRVQFQH